ncbi:hypothetical protein [Sphingobium aromaticiconvertens]|uniref:hypothetical protein n=1 Tax=Sphingobium aromaticiconvertens TaxID=365341 RepID=UPI00301AADAE
MTARTASGRPLRFFGALLFCWIMARVGFHLVPIPPAVAESVMATPRQPQVILLAGAMTPRSIAPHASLPPMVRPARTTSSSINLPLLTRAPVAHADLHRTDDDRAQDGPSAPPAPTAAPFTLTPSTSPVRDRWQLSLWALWRPNRIDGGSAASVGQLGGSQAGARLDLDLNPNAPSRLAAYARVTAALADPTAPEAALGVAYQPTRRLPVSLALERRIALGEGARDAMALMAVGGFGPTPVAPGLLAQAYGQAGIVGFRAGDRFVDGKISLMAPVERLPLLLGASLSGGAQPAVHRVDIGPEIQFQLPLPSTPARLSMEWRERIVGHASPASGLAITLAADF